jgi:hypothetical protein
MVPQQLLAGDPDGNGCYSLLVHWPAGAMSRPHFHTLDRIITVIRGTW